MDGPTKIPPSQEELDAVRALQLVVHDYLVDLIALQSSYPTPAVCTAASAGGDEMFGDMRRMVQQCGNFNQFIQNRLLELNDLIKKNHRCYDVEHHLKMMGRSLYTPPPATPFLEVMYCAYPALERFVNTRERELADADRCVQLLTKARKERQEEENARYWKERSAASAAKSRSTREFNKAKRELEASGVAIPTTEQILLHVQATQAAAATKDASRKAKAAARSMKKIGRGGKDSSSSARP